MVRFHSSAHGLKKSKMRPYPPERTETRSVRAGLNWLKMFSVYVLQDKNGKIYKGHTEDLARRFREHCGGHTKSTKSMIEPKIVYEEQYKTREEAIIREKYLKSAAGRKFLKNKMRP